VTDRRASVATVAATEPLRPVPPAAYPVIIAESRQVSRQALVAYRGNRYSVPPELVAGTVTVSHPVGAEYLNIATHRQPDTDRRGPAPDRCRRRRDRRPRPGHVVALDQAALAGASSARPHRRKERIPPGPAASAAAQLLLPIDIQPTATVTDLSAYEAAAQNQDHPPMTTKINNEPGTATQASLYQQLRSHLATLKLTTAAEQLPTVLDRASAEGLSLTAALEQLLRRRGRRQPGPPPRRPAPVRLPAHPRLTGRLRLRRRHQPGPAPDQRARHLPLSRHRHQRAPDRATRSREDPSGGRPRTGRRRGRLPDLLHHRRRPRRPLPVRSGRAAIEGRWATTMRFFAGPTLLVIDELGYLPLPGEAASALFQVMSQRYLKTSIVITSNRGVGAWGDILGDTTVAAALLDRLLHRSVVINLDGDSYRLRNHHAAADQLRQTTTGTRQPLR